MTAIKNEKKWYTLDDSGNSEILKDLFGKNVMYNYTEKTWYYWNEMIWAADDGRFIATCVDLVVKELEENAEGDSADEEFQKALIKHLKYSRSQKGAEACEKSARHKMACSSLKFDRNPMMFNTASGVVVLEKGVVIGHNAEMYFTRLSPQKVAATSDCPVWRRFLDEIFGGDEELIRFVQKAVGYSLTGSVEEQCLFFAYGSGCNGKSTFLNVLTEIFGTYALNIQPQTIMAQRYGFGGAASPDIARLKGARLVTTAEPNEGERLNEGLIKQMTGGDEITARFLYGREFQFKPEFKLWIAANNKPAVRGADWGIWRRIKLIPFSVTIPPERIDRELPEKLRAEYPEILRWAVEGSMLWRKEGLGSAQAVDRGTNEYRMETDTVAAFTEECCRSSPDARTKSSELYAAYKHWCEENGRCAKSLIKFSTELSKQYVKERDRAGSWFLGVGLA